MLYYRLTLALGLFGIHSICNSQIIGGFNTLSSGGSYEFNCGSLIGENFENQGYLLQNNLYFFEDSYLTVVSTKKESVTLFPNPFKDVLKIRNQHFNISLVELHALNGKLLYNQEIDDYTAEIEFELPNESEEIIIITIYYSNGTQSTHKAIKN